MNNKVREYSKVLNYLREHLEDYSNRELDFIFQNPNMWEYDKFPPDVLRQIYDEVNLLEDNENLYVGFTNLLEKNFNINSNIVEVGGGVIPSLAKHIHLKQSFGTITVYDPRLSISYNSSERFILKKEKFTKKTKIKNADILIGFMPCDATELLIEKATDSKKDFMIALCEGGHNAFDDFYDDELWRKNIIEFANKKVKNNRLGILVKTNLRKYYNPYPIIYNKRKIK